MFQRTNKAVILEDKKVQGKNLERMIAQYCSSIEVIANYQDPEEAIKEIPKLPKVDILFIDWDLGSDKINAFQVLDELQKFPHLKFKVVYVTGHPEIMPDTFKVANRLALHFIKKPVHPEKLKEAESRLPHLRDFKEEFEELMRRYQEMIKDQKQVVWKEDNKSLILNLYEIFYIKVYGGFLRIVTRKEDIDILSSLTGFLKYLSVELPGIDTMLCQPNQSILVNRYCCIEGINKSKTEVVLTFTDPEKPGRDSLREDRFNISRKFRKEFLTCHRRR